MENVSATERELVVELTRNLVRIQSVNPPGDELPAAEYLAELMRDLGLEAEVQKVDENRANLVGRLPGSGSGSLVLTGHLDVVPPGGQAWKHAPFEADLVDGRIYGRGSADMKGGVAAIVVAMAALKRSGVTLGADVVLAATCGEETGMIGAQAMVEARALEGAKYLVVAEPSDLDVFIGEKGVLWLYIRAYGRTAHGSMPHLGVNAVSFMARLIPLLEAYPIPFEESPLLGTPTLSVNIIGGGNKTNVVPDVCEIAVDMRTVPGQSHQAIVDQIKKIASDLAQQFHDELRVEVEIDQDVEPLESEAESELVRALSASVRQVTGKDVHPGGVAYGTDGAFLGPGFRIPVVICGPGAPGMAHQPDEWVAVDQLVQAVAIYSDLARRLLG